VTFTRIYTCDRCGKVDKDDGKHQARETGLQMSRTDPPNEGGNYPMRFTSWDLCDECGQEAQAMLRAWAPPSHDSWTD
jgi:hypothetical protein